MHAYAKFDHISNALKELHWLPVEQRIIFKINVIRFKVLKNLASGYLVELLRVCELARCLRSSSDKWRLVTEPRYNLTRTVSGPFQTLPLYSGTICLSLLSVDDVHEFKSKLKSEVMNYLRILFFISRCFCLFLLECYNIKMKCKLV